MIPNPIKVFGTGESLCTRCNQSYPLTSEYWLADEDNPNGYRRPCKACRKASHKLWLARHPNYWKEYEARRPGRLCVYQKRKNLERVLQKNRI